MTLRPTWDLSAQLHELCDELSTVVPELQHIDPQGVLFCLSRSRAAGLHGVYARIAPLRFAQGQREQTLRRGRTLLTYRLPCLTHDEREILYVIYLMVPRFLRLTLRERLETVIHELYHISEAFDGDIRRLPGRNPAHGSSRKRFQERIAALTDHFLAQAPDLSPYPFLTLTEGDWEKGQVRLTGLRLPLPKAQLVARRRL